MFLHAAEAIHGDLGMMVGKDIICISKSGNSPEISISSSVETFWKYADCYYRKHDFFSSRADHVLNTTVNQEACPINLAPTSSTTAQLVMGDALAVCLRFVILSPKTLLFITQERIRQKKLLRK
jgi:arabinose-5-phosphate isomerase